MSKLNHINKMASPYRHATLLTSINHNLFVYILISLLLPRVYESAAKADEGRRLTKEYHLRQGALRGFVVKPSRQYQLQNVEIFLGIPYAAPPVAGLRFMPPVSALPWSGVRMATRFAPVCPQSLPLVKKNNPPSLGRQNYVNRIIPFLRNESEDCLYLNIFVPYREQKSKKFPVLVFIHGDSFEWGSGNSYDGRILAAYGNIMVVTLNFRLGILGFMKPSLTEHVYGNNGLLDQLAALQWIKDNIHDMNGDPNSVTLMGHGTGAACVNFLMMSPISSGLFHRAILMSGSALSDWALTKDPAQYTLQVAQSLNCNLNKDMMGCLRNKSVSELKRIQILSREFATPLGPVVAGSFIPGEPLKTMEAYPNLFSKYQLLCGVTELESYHEFGVIELAHGILDEQRNEFIRKYVKILFESGEDVAFREIIKQYAPSKLDPQRWSVETNRDFILNILSDSRTVAPMIRTAHFQSKANRQSYFYVFGHNSESTDYAALQKSVHGEEIPYVLGIPLGGAVTHFHSEYTQKEKLLSEVMMRLWTNFVKIGTPNTQRKNEYFTDGDKNQYNIDWPEYNVEHQSYLKLDIPPAISSFYRSNYTKFWIESLPNKMKGFTVDPLFEYHPSTHATSAIANKPKPPPPPPLKSQDTSRRTWHPAPEQARHNSYNAPSYGYVRPNPPPQQKPDTDVIYREIQAIKTPSRPVPHGLMEKPITTTSRIVTNTNVPVKSSGSTFTILITLGLLFLLANVTVCAVLYFKRRRLRTREKALEARNSRADIDMCDGVLKTSKDDKSALRSLKNGCSVLKSISIDKIRTNGSKIKKNKLELCKTPKSDDSGGFRERFQLRRHLSTSTLDANTKVRDWIANEVLHRCSPGILRNSIMDLHSEKQLSELKPYTRSEEILSEVKTKHSTKVCNKNELNSKLTKARTLEKTTSTSALGSHSSIGKTSPSVSSAKNTTKSSDSIRSKGTESVKSKKVSVAIDATPSARTNSILNQEPIEISKSLDLLDSMSKHSKDDSSTSMRSKTEEEKVSKVEDNNQDKTYTCVVNLSVKQEQPSPLKISHKHSTSDPVTDMNYDKILKQHQKTDFGVNILPPILFRNDVNVTSRDDIIVAPPVSSAEALLTIQRRNYPKVLPDLPTAQKRLSLQPNSFHTFRNFSGSFEQSERSKIPPQPPPRTTTLERRLAYKNTKPNYMSSFDASNKPKKSDNYENIDSLSPLIETNSNIETISASNIPSTDSKIVISPSKSHGDLPTNAGNIPNVLCPRDIHLRTSGSLTSFSYCSEEDDEDIIDIDDLEEDKLIQELVGGVDSESNLDNFLDTKGPSTDFEKKLQLVPVKINLNIGPPKSKEDYVCISNLMLPGICDLEKTAQIKPNYGLNKLQNRSESINRPPEKSLRIKPKKNLKPTTILNRSFKKDSKKTAKSSSLQHSTSGSSNDTETSTGTVRKVEIKK